MKIFSSTFSMCAVAFCLAALSAVPAIWAQDVPEPSSSLIRMRGVDADLSNSADTFVSLDLNGDGNQDMLYYRPGGGYARAYLSHGDGTFRKVSYVEGGTGYNGFPGDLSSSRDTFVALDLNGDGKSDFIEYRPGSGFTILCLSKGDGTVNCSNLSDPNGTYRGFQDNMRNGNERIVALDLNHDGRSDFIVYTPGGGSANAYLSNGDGTVQRIVLTTNGSPNTQVGFRENMNAAHVRIVPIDLNGDGYADLLVYAPESGVVRTYLNSRSNTFVDTDLSIGGSQQNGFTGNSQNLNAHAIALDFNGGKQGFLWWEAGSQTVIEYASKGDGTVTAQPLLQNGTRANGFVDADNSVSDAAMALDLNGDGKQDFLWYSPGNGAVTGYVSNSSGGLTAYQYQTNQNNAFGFISNRSSSADQLLPVNFLGQASSGFLWYTPGSGSLYLFSPYTATDGGTKLNSYQFQARPASFQGDLAWSIQNLPLKEIVMPGTHDSAMYAMTDGENDINETQWGFRIADQLDAGARAIDFRTGYFVDVNSGFYDPDGKLMIIDQTPAQTTSDFYMYGHQNTLSNVTTLKTLNDIEDWLNANPTEVVIVTLTNQLIHKSQRDMSSQFTSLLQNTNYPGLIYTPLKACGSTKCADNLEPHNMSIAALKLHGTRLIINGGDDQLDAYGWTWGGEDNDVGYCENFEGGRSTAIDEIDCINNASNEPGNQDDSITSARPDYQAADAASQFLNLKAGLTPGGFAAAGRIISVLPPLSLADAGEPYGFNVGSQEYDLNQQLANGAWSNTALNLWNVDGLRANDDLTRLILQRNNQTWTNMQFFNNNLPNAAAALSVGKNGDVWAAGSGHSISIFKYVNGAWKDMINSQPNVKKLAVDPQGGVWVVDGSQGRSSLFGSLIHYDANGQNKNVTGSVVQDVAVGKNGSVWAMGLDGSIFEAYGPTDGSPDIKSSVPTQYGSHVAVDNMGHPWVVDNNGYVQKFNGSGWQQVSGDQGKEIVAGADGSIFITGYNTPSIGRYNVQNNSFDFLHMDAAHIAVDGGGQPWAIRQITGAVYKGSLDQM